MRWVFHSTLTYMLHSPEFKRLSAIQGDHGFQADHRSAFSKFAATQDVWSSRSCPRLQAVVTSGY